MARNSAFSRYEMSWARPGPWSNAQHQLTSRAQAPKQKASEPFKGKDSILSWTTHMNNYRGGTSDEEARVIAIGYLHGPAHEWRIVDKETEIWAQCYHLEHTRKTF